MWLFCSNVVYITLITSSTWYELMKVLAITNSTMLNYHLWIFYLKKIMKMCLFPLGPTSNWHPCRVTCLIHEQLSIDNFDTALPRALPRMKRRASINSGVFEPHGAPSWSPRGPPHIIWFTLSPYPLWMISTKFGWNSTPGSEEDVLIPLGPNPDF